MRYDFEVPSSAVDLSNLKRLSRIAFGQDYRLAVILEIVRSESGRVTQSGIAQSLGVSSSSIQKAFHDLVDLGLLVLEFEEGQRLKFFVRQDSSLWSWAAELAASA